jgi:hypothetical protein
MVMARLVHVVTLVAGGFALSGCVASMAASAVGMAARSARGEPVSNAHLRPAAQAACSARAAEHGVVHVIDVEQRSTNRIVVWGTAGEGVQRRSFECGFGTAVTSFKLRAIKPRQ